MRVCARRCRISTLEKLILKEAASGQLVSPARRRILGRVRQFGHVAEGHGSLGNWVPILGGIVQINQVIVSVIRHKLQCLGNGNASHRCCSRFRAFPFSKLQDVFDDAVGELAFHRSV